MRKRWVIGHAAGDGKHGPQLAQRQGDKQHKQRRNGPADEGITPRHLCADVRAKQPARTNHATRRCN